MTHASSITWTTDFLDWVPWIETVDQTDPTPAQRAHIDEVLGQRKGATYYETLANDIESVRTRTVLFSDIFEGEGGTPRSDRELATTATSRINGCVYCASVHARLFANLTKKRELTQRILNDGVDTNVPDHERAIIDLSEKLTLDPEALTAEDILAVREQGFDELGILDLIQSAAIFANANRLMLSLGEPATQAART